MSWAEFVLRSIGFREEQEFKMIMARESAYWSYRASMVYSKKKPKSKEEFWPIGKVKKKNSVSEEAKKRLMEETAAWARKSKQRNG